MGSSNQDYRALLEKAYSKLPQHVEAYDRFSIPRPDVRQIGRKTVVLNFKDICDQLRRDPDHLLKFLTGEMATLATFDGTKAIFQGKFGLESISNLLKIYTEKYVICPVCKRPDTHLERQKRLWFMECEACGARSSIGIG
ncbi:MAG: translation initiation factor IF-2 subunit beta [Candidatus Bathyarchaeia archaeon]